MRQAAAARQVGVRLGRGAQAGPWQLATLAAAVSAALGAVPAARAEDGGAAPLESVVVTAQKQTEDLQAVPLAIQALGTEKLEEMHVQSLDDYVKILPSVTIVRGQGQGGNSQPGTSHVYIRGVVSGGDGNHSGSLPSVGTYLDEQPVTTIDGALDVHIYDIERVEVLAGPQGTLYGASSESGTIRIITNKPDPKKFSAAYDLGVDQVNRGGLGTIAEGFINIPLTEHAAVRLVGWDEHDAGYISNVAGTSAIGGITNGVRTFPSWSNPSLTNGNNGGLGQGSVNNAAYVKDKYNTVDTAGGRAALKLDLDNSWTVSPTFMGQKSTAKGSFAYDPSVGMLQVAHFGPESSTDTFAQTALTIEGKVHDFDLVYAGAWMKRESHTVADYSDYAFFYDNISGSGKRYLHNINDPTSIIDPVQWIYGDNWYSKWSHELRVSTPRSNPVKATVGAFVQRQVHEIYQNYLMPGYNGVTLDPALAVPGWPGTLWLTDEERVDQDKAIFAQVTWDISPSFAFTGGLRHFWSDNSLYGFYGNNANFSTGQGTATCGTSAGAPNPNYAPFHGAPCTDLNSDIKQTGNTPLATLTWYVDDDKMLYTTFSKGFRPGGANRGRDPDTHLFVAPYTADFLTNYEIGWKTQWAGQRVRWNGAFFRENWKDFQFSYLVPPSLTVIGNAGNARIDGVESQLEWSVRGGLSLAANLTLLDGKLTQDYCKGPCDVNHPLQAAAGTRLPVAPHFKGDLVARQTFDLGGWKSNVQGSYTFQGNATPLMLPAEVNVLGKMPAYETLDLSAGMEQHGLSFGVFVTNVFDKRGQLTRYTECNTCQQVYIVPIQPMTVGLKFGQKF